MTGRAELLDDVTAAVAAAGKCVGTGGPQRFPRDGFTPEEYRSYAAWACAGCPVQVECATLAVLIDARHGVWGGCWAPDLHGQAPEPGVGDVLPVVVEVA